jgi:hypothetical protein
MHRPASSPVAAPPKLKSVLVCHTSPAHDSSMTSRCLASSSPTSFKDALLGIRRDGEVRQAADGDQGWQLVTSKRTRCAVVHGAARDSALRHDRSACYLAKVQGRCFNCLSPHHLVAACRSQTKCWRLSSSWPHLFFLPSPAAASGSLCRHPTSAKSLPVPSSSGRFPLCRLCCQLSASGTSAILPS